ncbi:MAG: hypothetical protein ABI479_07440 [Gallionella sp.]
MLFSLGLFGGVILMMELGRRVYSRQRARIMEGAAGVGATGRRSQAAAQ